MWFCDVCGSVSYLWHHSVLPECRAPSCDVAWRGVTWRDVAWRGVTWRDVPWRGGTMQRYLYHIPKRFLNSHCLLASVCICSRSCCQSLGWCRREVSRLVSSLVRITAVHAQNRAMNNAGATETRAFQSVPGVYMNTMESAHPLCWLL